MRQSKDIQINNKTVSVFELTVRDIKSLWKHIIGATPEAAKQPIFSNDKILRDYWDKCIHGLKLDETEDMTPSELKVVYDAFMEVNADFFALALQIEGENPMLKALRAVIVNDLMLRYAALSPEDTAESGNTDTASSLPPAEKT
jgi:hypothetical protein